MIITRTPFRISFVGGGSDMESFYSNQPGAVLSTTINKYMYISTHRYFDPDKLRLKYSKTETVDNVADVQHPIVREVLKRFNVQGGLEISSNADIPAGTGLGSSSSFTVGLLHNMSTRVGSFAPKKKLAEDACEIEIERLREPIGKQDQFAAAFGGLNVISFSPSGQVDVEPLHLRKSVFKRLQNNLLMFYTGITRGASSILKEQKRNLELNRKTETLGRMVALVDELRVALHEGDLTEFGRILHRNWELKRGLANGVSNGRIEEFYNAGMSGGALGGKLLGAGGGGFLLFYCEEEKHDQLRSALSGLRELQFKLESGGSRVIHEGDEYDES